MSAGYDIRGETLEPFLIRSLTGFARLPALRYNIPVWFEGDVALCGGTGWDCLKMYLRGS